MSKAKDTSSLSQENGGFPVVQISYACVFRERLRESSTYLYEVACSVAYPATTGHLSLRVTGQNTYRNSAPKEVPFTLHEAGATTYVELLESEQLEVRIVEFDGGYSKAIYYARNKEIVEQNVRRMASVIQQLDALDDAEQSQALG